MEHLIKKFGFISEAQFLSVTKTLSSACGTNLNKTRYKFAKEKGFETVKSYLQCLNTETSSNYPVENKPIENNDYIEFDMFDKSNFMKERSLIYFTETSIIIEMPILHNHIQNDFNIDNIRESLSESLSNTDLICNTQFITTFYKDLVVFTGEFCYNDLLENKVDLEDFANRLSSVFNSESAFSLFIDHLNMKVSPGYIAHSDDIIDYYGFNGYTHEIEIKYKRAISNAYFWGQALSRDKNDRIEYRKKFLKSIIIKAITDTDNFITNF